MDNRTKKTNNKRFVRYSEGAEMYSMSVSKFMQLAKDAKACYKVNQLVLVNLDIIDEYLMATASDYSAVYHNLSVCALSVLYAVIAKIVVVIMLEKRQ